MWAIFGSGQKIAMGIGALIGGVLVALYSFRTLFIIVTCLNAIATLFALKILRLKKTRN